MDYIEGIAKQASQLTMYDVKSYYNQAKNMVLNVSEMEAKVREATNDDPWGASSTLMQQIADGTQNFAQFNEIMPCIYSRFMEKEAREWRQIYKSLTLLEFLVKNGSERVVDDARAHVSTIKMLRSFHYVDEKGKDQGINVRNRASEIALLLGDVEKIRQERRKAKANKTKYQGQGNDGGMSFVTAGGSRYGGFGSESVSGGGGGGEGRYGGSGGGSHNHGDEYRTSSRGFADRQGGNEYDEYEGADDFEDQPPRRTTSATSSRPSRPNPPPKSAPKAEPKPVEKPKEVNLFDFDDDDTPAAAPAPAAAPVGGDDDFDDFQSAPAPSAQPAAAAPPRANANLFDLLNSNPSVPAPQVQAQVRAPTFSATQPPAYSGISPQPAIASRPSYTSTASTTTTSTTATAGALSPKPTGSSSASTFDDLWTSSLSTLGSGATKPTSSAAAGKSINEMEKEKAINKLWGPTPGAQPYGQAQAQAPAQNKPASGGFDDLLL